MDDLDDVMQLPDDFDGRVRLFPLPELVLFPHAMQPLHIFEPRYCEMLNESLASDQLIAMATLTSSIAGKEKARPAIAATVCIGRIESHAKLQDDKHNLLLVGIKRASIVRELDVARSFRIAEVDVHPDVYPPAGALARRQLKKSLLQAFASVIPASQQVTQGLHELMAGQMGLGPITDIISYTLPFPTADKLRLLRIANVDERASELVKLLKSGVVQLNSVSTEEQSGEPGFVADPPFPPPFSVN